MESVCPICGVGRLVAKKGNFHFTPPDNIPGGEIVVRGSTWEECSDCEERILSKELLDKLDGIRYERLGLLTPVDIRNIRERAGLSQIEISQLLGVGEKTYTRWESGRSLQNKSSDNLIRVFEQNAELFTRLEAQRNPDRQNQIAKYIKSLERLKEKNESAIAAHGGELDPSTQNVLRKCLLEIVNSE